MCKMPETIPQSPPEEQKICVTCGFCCDATIFLHAHLDPDERGNIPVKLEESIIVDKGVDYFLLPCPYFKESCTIYDRKRANVCGSYRCQLLKDFAAGKITAEEAMKVVSEAREMRTGIMNHYMMLSGTSEAIPFRHLLRDFGKSHEADGGLPAGMEAEMLVARCNIFEALLIKTFRSADDFDKLVMK